MISTIRRLFELVIVAMLFAAYSVLYLFGISVLGFVQTAGDCSGGACTRPVAWLGLTVLLIGLVAYPYVSFVLFGRWGVVAALGVLGALAAFMAWTHFALT